MTLLLLIPVEASALETTCKVSMSQYLQLRDGMTYSDAVRILGCPGVEFTRSTFMDVTMVVYSWSGNSFLGNMNATFQNDAMIGRAQMGLK
jgi:hypothetical protein